MARFELNPQFTVMQQRIRLGDRALIAIAAHQEVRQVLRSSTELLGHGLEDVLIGSYGRKVSTWPGKDVDVFGRLSSENTESITADETYEMFGRALDPFAAQSRLTRQPRSFKIAFSRTRTPSVASLRSAAQVYEWEATRAESVIQRLPELAFEFSVDVVPAVKWGKHYGIPEVQRDPRTDVVARSGRWRLTNPVALTDLTHERNRDPQIDGIGGFVRVVRMVRQIKSAHLPDAKPGALYYEMALHEGFRTGAIVGASWADIAESALVFLASRLASSEPIRDPVLDVPYQPAPTQAESQVAAETFAMLARRARSAVTADSQCQAAHEWRAVFGGNGRDTQVFPLPPGCRGTGATMGAAAANLAVGGSAERGFGGR